mmetsp:Transcript_24430/g.61404  ORF Transcript_24430/g.61404 Transcript_24430/m.61404 type:complete len:368 (+) Transcript_24430:140-1243(+)
MQLQLGVGFESHCIATREAAKMPCQFSAASPPRQTGAEVLSTRGLRQENDNGEQLIEVETCIRPLQEQEGGPLSTASGSRIERLDDSGRHGVTVTVTPPLLRPPFLHELRAAYAKTSRAVADLFSEKIFHDLDGTAESLESLKRMGVQSGTYGEITPQGVERMLQKLKTGHEFSLTDEDVFLDLGAGVGKVVLHVFLATAVGTVVGVEWGEKRCAKALLARDRLLENVLRHHAPDAAGTEAQAGVQELFKEKITFRCEDVARTDLSAATVVFFCCIVFEEQTVKRVAQKLLEKAKKLRFFITTQKVPDDKYLRAWVSLPRAEKPVLRTYELVDRWRLPMSWTSEEGGNMTYVYAPVWHNDENAEKKN